MKFNLDRDGFGGRGGGGEVLWSEPGGGDGVVQEVRLVLRPFIEGDGDSSRRSLYSKCSPVERTFEQFIIFEVLSVSTLDNTACPIWSHIPTK